MEIPEAFFICETVHWTVSHRINSALRGSLTVGCKQLSEDLAGLSSAALAELGPLLAQLQGVLRQVLRSERIYVGCYGHAPGYPVHFQLIPIAVPPPVPGPSLTDTVQRIRAALAESDNQSQLLSHAVAPERLYELLRSAWSLETSGKWRADNPGRGQCSVTALVVQDILGGGILKTRVDGGWHFYNAIGGRRWDFTASQFDALVGYEDLPASREEAFSDTSIEQYHCLANRVRLKLQSLAVRGKRGGEEPCM